MNARMRAAHMLSGEKTPFVRISQLSSCGSQARLCELFADYLEEHIYNDPEKITHLMLVIVLMEALINAGWIPEAPAGPNEVLKAVIANINRAKELLRNVGHIDETDKSQLLDLCHHISTLAFQWGM